MLNLVRQDPAWDAVESNLARPAAGVRLVDGFEVCAAVKAEPPDAFEGAALVMEPLEAA
jgi:hypothetical protein